MRLSFSLPVAVLVLAVSGSAPGQDAMGLFRQGRALADRGDWAGSCPLFEEAHRLQPDALGIHMNLADCQRHTGKLASSLANYVEAEARARAKGEAERAQYAHDQAAAIEPRVAKLRINAAPTPGLRVTRNDHEIGAGILGSPFPVDAGDHTVKASAPGFKSWSTVVKVQGDGASVSVDVPALVRGEGGEADTGGGAGGSVRKPIGFAALGVGAAGLVAGAVTAGLTASKRSSLLQQCPTGHCLQSQQQALQPDVDSMHTLAAVSTAGFVAGGVLAAAGVILVVTAPRAAPQAVGVTPLVGPGFLGLAGRF